MTRSFLTGTQCPLPLALSLLVSSTSSQRWRGALGEAARLLAPGWDDDSYISDLGTLTLVLHLRAQDDRLPHQIPLRDILATLTPVDAAGEPEFVRESWDLLRQTGEAPAITASVENGAGQVWLVQRDLGDRYEGGDMDGTYGPGPSAFQSAAVRLRTLFTELGEEQRETLNSVPVPSGSVQIEATDGVKIITTGSVMAVRCSHQGCPAEGGTVTVDGMRARYVCPDGHTNSPWSLTPAHARWALRHVGHDPASSGRLRVDGPFHVPQASESPRMELSDNVWLRQHERSFEGYSDVLRQLDAAADEVDRPRHVHPEIPQEVTVEGGIEILAGEPGAGGAGGTEPQRIRCPECGAETGLVLRGMWGEAPSLTCPIGDSWELPDPDLAIQLFKDALNQMEPLGLRAETDEES